MLDFSDGKAGAGSLEVGWHAGWASAKHDPAPEIQAHAYDAHTMILRQNKSVSHEAPFMFLLSGNSHDHLRARQDMLTKADGTPGAPPFGEIGTYPHDTFIVWRL